MNTRRVKGLLLILGWLVFLPGAGRLAAREDMAIPEKTVPEMRRLKGRYERLLEEVEAGTTVLVPYAVLTKDAGFMTIDDYRRLPQDKRPELAGPDAYLRLPVKVGDFAERMSASKATPEEAGRAVRTAVAESKEAAKGLRTRLAALDRLINQAPAVGAADVVLPDLAGLPVRKAREMLEAAGLKAKLEMGRPAPSADQVYHVYATAPAAGRTMAKGDEAKLTVYAPPDEENSGGTARPPLPQGSDVVVVPDLVTLPVGQARDKLEALGLVVVVKVGKAATYAGQTGRVYRSESAPGGRVKKGDRVVLTVYDDLEGPEATSGKLPPDKP